jgi:hypothetical protein
MGENKINYLANEFGDEARATNLASVGGVEGAVEGEDVADGRGAG